MRQPIPAANQAKGLVTALAIDLGWLRVDSGFISGSYLNSPKVSAPHKAVKGQLSTATSRLRQRERQNTVTRRDRDVLAACQLIAHGSGCNLAASLETP
jgi:hypothetical protein